MRVTSTVASKKVKELKEQIEQAKVLDMKSRYFLACIGEDPESVRPEYDFLESTQNIAALEAKLRKIKHAINVFNTQQKLDGFEITIDEALVMLPQLTVEKQRLTEMAAKLPKERKSQGYLSNTSIIDYQYVNYDLNLAKRELEETTKLLSNIQTELNRVNTTVEFEIPD